jgi:superfamily II DNA or RNA helicase
VSLSRLLTQLDPDPDKRGREFERICRWYLTNDPEYRRYLRRVWLWNEWPDAWGPDAGIDLVAEENEGGLWAIQAKVYDPAYAIKKSDVDSFLSESARPGFVYRLLIATTDLIGVRARRTIQEQERPAGLLLRSQLAEAAVAWPHSLAALRPSPRRPRNPRADQREALGAIERGFDSTDRGQAIMACGTGKTLVGLWTAERVDAQRTLVLLPSLSLLAQTLREWAANASSPFQYLAVCSDETVTGEDQFVSHTAELGLPVTTDPAEIAAFQRRRGRRVVFSTYQSSPQIAAAFENRIPRFDLAIADEAHRCAGRVGTEFTTILDPALIGARRRLFMTATPRFYTPRIRREAGQLDVEVASMDDCEAFGPVLHRLSFGEAIERDLLSDYQAVVVGVTNTMYRRWAERGEFVTLDGERVTDARALAGQIGLAKTMRKYDLERIVSFHSRVTQARRFADELPAVITWLPRSSRPSGRLWSEHVSGAMSSGQRDARLRRLRAVGDGERGLLTNARCLGEGVDVPTLDGVAFIDPRRSTIDIIQALGRAIRKASAKKLGTIVVPVFVEEGADPEEALDESAFRHVWDVLKALRAHDEQLADELDELRRRLGARRAPPKRPGKVKLDLPREVGVDFARAFDVCLVEKTTASWEFYFGLLERFVEREGHARVPRGHRERGYRLGRWVTNQHRPYRQGTLDPERRALLEALPGWTWDRRDSEWEDSFTRLRRFVEREGHARVPRGHREDGHQLDGWVLVQRQANRKGTLDPERRARLEALSGWAWDALEAEWEEGFANLRRFIEREGHARVPRSHRENGHNLAQWILVRRQQYRKRTLDPKRRALLEALPGWTWEPHGAGWEEGFAHLERFVAREGHTHIPAKYQDQDGFSLGNWVSRQRHAWKRDKLREERARRLEAVPGWAWDLLDAAWEEGLNRLLAFVEREGHSRVPGNYRDDGYRPGGGSSSSAPIGSAAISQRIVRAGSKPCRTGSGTRARRSGRRAMPDWSALPSERAIAGCRSPIRIPTDTRLVPGWQSNGSGEIASQRSIASCLKPSRPGRGKRVRRNGRTVTPVCCGSSSVRATVTSRTPIETPMDTTSVPGWAASGRIDGAVS